jgi:hypothetical protein
VEIGKCGNVEIGKYENVEIGKYENVEILLQICIPTPGSTIIPLIN